MTSLSLSGPSSLAQFENLKKDELKRTETGGPKKKRHKPIKTKKLKNQAQVQENIEITFMSAWFVMGVFLVLLIIYSMQS